MFPQRLDSTVAYDIAKAMMDGFNRHYRLFRSESARAQAAESQRDRAVGVLRELADLMDAVREGSYTPDSFTTQPARALLGEVGQ